MGAMTHTWGHERHAQTTELQLQEAVEQAQQVSQQQQSHEALLQMQPLKKEDTILGIVLSYALILLFLGAMMIKMDVASEDEQDQEVFGLLLVAVFFAGVRNIGRGLLIVWSLTT